MTEDSVQGAEPTRDARPARVAGPTHYDGPASVAGPEPYDGPVTVRPPARRLGPLDRLRAWLVTGALGRGTVFAIDFAAALRELIRSRRR